MADKEKAGAPGASPAGASGAPPSGDPRPPLAAGPAFAAPLPRAPRSALARVLAYAGSRLLSLALTVAAAMYLTILVANMGGHVDVIKRSQIREQVAIRVGLDAEMQRLAVEERQSRIQEIVRMEEEQFGLHRPFVARSLVYLRDALLLRLGFAERMTSDSGSRLVRSIILERLPPTLLLFGTAQLLVFAVSVAAALSLSRLYGSFLDRAIVALAPTSAAPAWFYGIFLILLFAAVLGVMPFGGMVQAPPPEHPLAYAASVLKHMALPLLALFLSSIFVATYSWRTFFLVFSSEDYVEAARARGLPARLIERRYILRPTLPTIVTSFSLSIISAWYGAIILETVFGWPGLGRALFQAIGSYDTPVIVGVTIIYAYLLAVTVFVLDVVYAIVDPRVRIAAGGRR